MKILFSLCSRSRGLGGLGGLSFWHGFDFSIGL